MIDVEGVRDWVPRLQIGLPVLFGLWGIWLLRRPPVTSRTDRRMAIRLAAAIGVLLITIGTLLFSQVAGMFSNRPDWQAGLTFGFLAAILVPFSAIAGYALLARLGARRLVWLGFVGMPLVLMAGPQVAFDQLRNLTG